MLNIKRLAAIFFSSALMKVITAVLSFLLIAYLARTWEVEELGRFSTILSLFFLMMQMPLLGLHVVLIRDVAANEQHLNEYVSTAIILSFVASLVMAAAVVLVGQVIYPQEMHAPIYIVALGIVIFAFTAVFEAALFSIDKIHIVIWGNIYESIFRVICGFIAAYLGYGVAVVILFFVLGRIVALVVYQYKANIRSMWSRSSVSQNVLSYFYRKTPTVASILILSAIFGRIDFILLSLLGTMRDVGLYSPAYKIYEMGLMIPGMMSLVIFPTLAKLYEKDPELFSNLYIHLMRLVLIVGIPCIVIVAFLSEDLIVLFFGNEYEASATALKVLVGAVLLVAVDQLLIAVTYASKREDVELKVLLVSSFIYLTLLAILIPKYGFMGAAIATIVSAIVKIIARYSWLKNVVHMPSLNRHFLGIFAGLAVIISFYAYFAESMGLLTIFAGVITYVVVLVITRGVTRQDMNYVVQLVSGEAKNENPAS